MKKLCLFLIVFILSAVVITAQETPEEPTEEQEDTPVFTVQVVVDSLIIRSLPTTESEIAGSAFEDEILVAIGRDATGLWFEVRRPGTEFSAGWVFRRNVQFTFEVARLPITDLTTGVTGETPVFDSGVSVLILTEAALRDRPSTSGNQIGIVPILVTVPVIERTPDSRWLFINYLGTTGWIAEFLTSTTADLTSLPVNAAFGGNFIQLEIIPVEVQLAQAQRLRDYLLPNRDLANSIADYWSLMQTGEVIPCQPITNSVPFFSLTARDIVELPELRRFTRNLTLAVNDLNESIEATQRCGVYTSEEISQAYANAINARGIFNAALQTLDNVEAVILQ